MSKLKIALIGAGGRGTYLAKMVEVSGMGDLVMAHETNPEYSKGWMKRHEVSLPLVERDKILNDPSIDAVIVASPDHRHRDDASDVMRAGKPVLCEKPMAIRLDDCDEMLRVHRETKKSLQIGFNLRFHPMYQKMHEIAASGKLGRITTVWIRHFVGLGGDYYFHDWHGRRDKSTSLLLQKATHDFDVLHYVTGSYTKRLVGLGNRAYYGPDRENGARENDLTCPTCPDQNICPEVNRDPENPRIQCAFRKEIDIEDNEMVMLELESGALANYMQCQFTPDYHRNYVFIGTLGRMESFESMQRVKGWQNDTRIEILHRKGGYRETITFADEPGGHGGADIKMVKNWLTAVRNNSFNPENPIGGRQSVAVGCLAAESLRTGNNWMTVPPVQRS